MCGIVGLFLKDKSLEPKLGEMLSEMLDVMCGRGPDSAGFAVYGAGEKGKVKLTLRAVEGYDFKALEKVVGNGASIVERSTHAVLTVDAAKEAEARAALATVEGVSVVGAGERMELYKEVGLPIDVARRFKLEQMSGTHGIGHTRMATESAVTTNGAHPFSTGTDQCLVHNGSLSNHRGLRRVLERQGFKAETDNDSEIAAAYISQRMKDGRSLGEALEDSLDDLDGFYTFVVGTETGFGVLRDPIACKPAVMAETDQYVAFGSEYRALAGLPGIETAKVWEPEPAKVYFWDRKAA
ncbi:class II glutamine amidotransferase [Chenggangzhangella methanolivorans]|uniref:Glutamine amidotransferase family protein n=1 Tax=Chenggangzhangella methanolivorans TaxID=1437009 RepID=A0A9E6RI05_9HYPH|nr:glutamine amidotransferase family protein [Chenggangzhangella methanolivorans]QZO01806.1 glutamine amidotransferase family protein [Chenggangzhangella methanolivorans]